MTVKFLKEIEVSELTGIALSTLRNNRSKGRGIPYVKIGRSVRYEEGDVLAELRARKIRPNAAS